MLIKRQDLRTPAAARGSTLVEQAIVLPIVLLVAFAAVDASNLVQAYSALREGVKDSLRCVYPVEGKCVDINFNPPARLFDWYLEEHGPDSIVVSTVNYSAQSSWIRRPDYIYNSSSATILGAVNFQVAKRDYTAKSLRIPASSKADVVMLKSSIPAADGGSGSPAEKRDPKLHYFKAGENKSYPNSSSVPISDLAVTMTNKQSGNVTFHVPFPELPEKSTTKCFASSNLDKGGDEHEVDYNKECSALGQGYGELNLDNPWSKMSFVLHVKGAGEHTDALPPVVPDVPDCALGLSLKNQGMSNPGDKGGFQFDGDEYPFGVFVPRGGPAAFASPTMLGDDGSSEYISYMLTAKRAGPTSNSSGDIDISVKLASTLWTSAGKINAATDCKWNGTTAKIFTPEYSWEKVPVDCAPISLTQAEEPDPTKIPCVVSDQNKPALNGLPNGKNQPVQVDMASAVPSDDGSRDNFYGYYSLEHLKQHLADLGVPASTISDLDIVEVGMTWEARSRSCPQIAQSFDGSAPNYGVDGNPNAESQSAAMAICPPLTAAEMAQNPQIQNLSYSEFQSVALPIAHQGQTWAREDCSQLTPTLDGARLFYPKINLGAEDATATSYPKDRFVHNSTQSPAAFLATDQYSCGGFEEGGIVIDGAQELDQTVPPSGPSGAWTTVAMPASSLYSGTQDELGDCQLDRLKNEALAAGSTYGMTAQSYFVPTVKPIGEKQLGDIANCGGVPTAPPGDECVPYRISEGAVCTSTLLANAIPDGTTPAECSAPDSSCSKVFSGFDGVVNDGRTENFVQAADYGSKAIQAAYPRGLRDCEGENCFNITVSKSEDNKRLIGKGKIEVPMTLLAGSPITLSYSDQETAELEFVKN